jgi:hypothetical protein
LQKPTRRHIRQTTTHALHIAIAAVHGVDFLLSLNFKHIANPVIQAQIAARLAQPGLALPFICPPEELLGEDDE